jgi:hypothetical protein
LCRSRYSDSIRRPWSYTVTGPSWDTVMGQALCLGTHFGGTAVPGTFARSYLSLGVGSGTEQHHATPKLSLNVNHGRPVLLGKVHQLPVSQLLHIGAGERGDGTDL